MPGSPPGSMKTDPPLFEADAPVDHMPERDRNYKPLPFCPYRPVTTIIEDHNQCIYSVQFCPFADGVDIFATVADHNQCIYSVQFCPFADGVDIFATVAGRQVTVYECQPKKIVPLSIFQDPNLTEEYYAVNWALVKIEGTETPVLVFAGKHGIIRAIKPFTGKSVNTMIGHGDAVNEIVYHPVFPSVIASASKDLTVRLWHTLHSTPIAILGGFKGHQDQILTLDFDYTANYIISGSMDHTIRLWHIGGNENIQSRLRSFATSSEVEPKQPIEMHFPCGASKDLHRNYVDCIKTVKSYIFSKACENCIILSKFGEFRDPSAGGSGINGFETLSQEVAELELPNGGLWFIRFGITTGEPGKSFIACGNDVGTVHMWDINTIPIPKKSHYQISHKNFPTVIRRVEFSPSGEIMIVAGDGGRIARCDRFDVKIDIDELRDSSSAEVD
uniref:Embryonic ectoderm development protein n=1 Tax=Panagrolaimus sp. JU765 TaxID=591449 RepID=A0AC34QIH6_9BILA